MCLGMVQHGGMMNQADMAQQGFSAQNQLMSPTGAAGTMQTGIVVQGGFLPQGNTVMMATAQHMVGYIPHIIAHNTCLLLKY